MDDDDDKDIDTIIPEEKNDDKSATDTAAETAVETGKTEEAGKTTEENKDADKTVQTDTAGAGETKTAEEKASDVKTGEQTVAEGAEASEQKPLTAQEVRAIIAERDQETRSAGKGIEETEKEVMEAYYPQGLSNTLVDEKTGREIKSPQDVVDLSDGNMTIEEATQWLLNEQYKLDKSVNEIKESARELAETNYNFKQGAVRVLKKYQAIFAKYPQLQGKIYRNYMKTVKMDNDKELILSAPDIEDYYADVMEPYVMAFGYQSKTTEKTEESKETGKIPESKQTAADRMDVSGDGGTGKDDDVDPNDPEATLNKLIGE